MITEIDASLLEKIADLTGKPVGAFNIRKDGGCEARQSTEHIAIDPQPEGKSGIIIRIKDGTKGEQCHIPVIISKSGVTEMVYNDFYVGENCDVDIVAGCGIHNSGCNESRHDGVHTFYIGKNSHVRYSEKHYGEGDGSGTRVMNPTTIVYLDEGASIQMETVQIRGDTLLKCGGKRRAVGLLAALELLGDAAEEKRQNDAGVAARAAQQRGRRDRGGLIDRRGLDLLELLRRGLDGKTHVRARVAVGNGEYIQIIDSLLCLCDGDGAEEQHLLEHGTIDGIVHRMMSSSVFTYSCCRRKRRCCGCLRRCFR